MPRLPTDHAAAVRAVTDLLKALGIEPKDHPELAQTPELVARAWRDELLDGYATDPRTLLAERMPSVDSQLISLTGLDFQSVCPHHLMPYGGVAQIAYLPGEGEGAGIVGFGQLARLLDALGHRLILQEELARQLADLLVEELKAKGAAVRLTATQRCLTLRGARRCHAQVTVEALAGVFREDGELRGRWLATLGDGRRSDS